MVIEGYMIPGETRKKGLSGSLRTLLSADQYPVMHIEAITHRKDAVVPMTMVGSLQWKMDTWEAIGDAFLPVLQFQHRDVLGLFLPLETGFHNLAIVSSKKRYPRQGRKTALGLLGAGQMMFLKTIVAVDPNHDVKDLDSLLDALDSKVDISEDLIVLPGMVADSLAHASPWDNIHDKLLIDATTPLEDDPRSRRESLKGCPESLEVSASGIDGVIQARFLRSSMLVVTTKIEGGPSPEENVEENDEEGALRQRVKIQRIMDSIWNLEGAKSLRWLFITDSDVDLYDEGWMRVPLAVFL